MIAVAGHKHKTGTDIVLVPQPSIDINDPLNWPLWKRGLAFTTICIFTFLVSWGLGGIGVALVLLMEDLKSSLNETIHSTISWVSLTIGLAVRLSQFLADKNFFWIPTARFVGVRACFVVASCVFFATSLWAAAAENVHSLLGARVLAAFFGSSTEALAASIVA